MRLSGERIMPVRIQSAAATVWGSRLGKEAKDALQRLHQMKKADLITGNVIDKQAPPFKPGITEVPFTCGPVSLD
jgi:hypothetical protein